MSSYDYFDESKSAKRLKLLETNIINYFRLRDEDNVKKPIPTLNTMILANAPTSAPKVSFRPIDNPSCQEETVSIETNNDSSDDMPIRNYLSEYYSHDMYSHEAFL